MDDPTTTTSQKQDSRVKSGRYRLEKPSSEIEAMIGEQFRSVRRRQKVSLTTLSQALGVGIWMIRKHERGALSMRADLLVKAASVMQVDAKELLETTTHIQKENHDGLQGNA